MTQNHPDHVGTYVVGTTPHFYAVRRAELNRSGVQVARWLRSFDFPLGSYILTISVQEELPHFAPFEFGVQALGLFGTNADDSPYDAGRVESIGRQFDPVAICGVSQAILEGLKMFGLDAQSIFKGRIVWARPDAYDAIAAMDGVEARKVCLVGPTLALECKHGGLHIEGREWDVEADQGELVISSRLERTEPLHKCATGIKAKCVDTPCPCGSADPTIELTP